MTTSSLSRHLFERPSLADRARSLSYGDVEESRNIAAIPWHLISKHAKFALVASGFVIWYSAFGLLVAIVGD
jgi:hypothetical protein